MHAVSSNVLKASLMNAAECIEPGWWLLQRGNLQSACWASLMHAKKHRVSLIHVTEWWANLMRAMHRAVVVSQLDSCCRVVNLLSDACYNTKWWATWCMLWTSLMKAVKRIIYILYTLQHASSSSLPLHESCNGLRLSWAQKMWLWTVHMHAWAAQ